mmetsp:Transcript_108629/g.306215  ORF Transcript_108629/g.306215 Transcript_108629/m.306215 type:complete len:207 (+) Transcript_108629:147-767(+)
MGCHGLHEPDGGLVHQLLLNDDAHYAHCSGSSVARWALRRGHFARTTFWSEALFQAAARLEPCAAGFTSRAPRRKQPMRSACTAFWLESRQGHDDAFVAAVHARAKAVADSQETKRLVLEALQNAASASQAAEHAKQVVENALAARKAISRWQKERRHMWNDDLPWDAEVQDDAEQKGMNEVPSSPLFLPPIAGPVPLRFFRKFPA